MSYTVRKFYPVEKGLTQKKLLEIGLDWGLIKKFNKLLACSLAIAPLAVAASAVGALIYKIRGENPNFLTATQMYGGNDQGHMTFGNQWKDVRDNNDKVFDAIQKLFSILYYMAPAYGLPFGLLAFFIGFAFKKSDDQKFSRQLWVVSNSPVEMVLRDLNTLGEAYIGLVKSLSESNDAEITSVSNQEALRQPEERDASITDLDLAKFIAITNVLGRNPELMMSVRQRFAGPISRLESTFERQLRTESPVYLDNDIGRSEVAMPSFNNGQTAQPTFWAQGPLHRPSSRDNVEEENIVDTGQVIMDMEVELRPHNF